VMRELPPEIAWFADLQVFVDLGYRGRQSEYRGDPIESPHKKPRKSKKKAHPQLSEEQKTAKKVLRQVRIFVAHAIGGMKRYNILVYSFRNHKENFEDDVIGICAGLWNLALAY
jgi:DDE superfamily endonuclease